MANLCAGAHPAWVHLVQVLAESGVLRGRQRSPEFRGRVMEVARLFITYQGIHTVEREAITPELASVPRAPFIAVREGIARITEMSASAVYRILDLLCEVGLLRRVGALRRRCHSGTTSPTPESHGAWYLPITYVIGERFEKFFPRAGVEDGTELAVSSVENQCGQKRLPNLTGFSTDSGEPDSEMIQSIEFTNPDLLSALPPEEAKAKVIEAADDLRPGHRRSPRKLSAAAVGDVVREALAALRSKSRAEAAEDEARARISGRGAYVSIFARRR